MFNKVRWWDASIPLWILDFKHNFCWASPWKINWPRKFNVFHISPLTSLNLVLIPGTKLDRHPALRQGVSTSLSLLLGRSLSTFLHAFVDACVSFDPEIPFSMFPNDQKNMLSSFYGSFKLIFKTIISFVLR